MDSIWNGVSLKKGEFFNITENAIHDKCFCKPFSTNWTLIWYRNLYKDCQNCDSPFTILCKKIIISNIGEIIRDHVFSWKCAVFVWIIVILMTNFFCSWFFFFRTYNIFVEDIMVRNMKFISWLSTYKELQDLLNNSSLTSFPLVDAPGKIDYCSLVTEVVVGVGVGVLLVVVRLAVVVLILLLLRGGNNG